MNVRGRSGTGRRSGRALLRAATRAAAAASLSRDGRATGTSQPSTGAPGTRSAGRHSLVPAPDGESGTAHGPEPDVVAVSGATPGAASVMRVGTSVGGAGRHIMAAGATRERSPRLVPPPPSVARSSRPRAPGRGCATRGAIIDAVDGFGPSTYGDAFADIYDDWYADLSDLDACVDAARRPRRRGPGGGDRRRHRSGRRPAGRTRCPRRRRRQRAVRCSNGSPRGGRTCTACGPTPPRSPSSPARGAGSSTPPTTRSGASAGPTSRPHASPPRRGASTRVAGSSSRASSPARASTGRARRWR